MGWTSECISEVTQGWVNMLRVRNEVGGIWICFSFSLKLKCWGCFILEMLCWSLWKAPRSPYSHSCTTSWGCSSFFHFSDLFCWVTEAQLMYLPSSSFTLGRLKLSCMFSWYKLNMCACFHVIGAGRHHSNYRFSTNSLGLQDGRPLWQTTATEVKGSIALLLGILFFFCLLWPFAKTDSSKDHSRYPWCVPFALWKAFICQVSSLSLTTFKQSMI